jgi:anaphase-promoting complex subunit 1
MAGVQSLGLHTPSALPHLIAESILPPDPPSDSYSWEVYINGSVEEEILFTSDYVAWSQGRVIRKIFSFDIEQEKVHHALLTWFPSHETRDYSIHSEPADSMDLSQFSDQAKDAIDHSMPPKESPNSSSYARALVVLLQYQAHIFFLSGASHLVKLPFEVECVFPAPRGIILQRRLTPALPMPSQSSIGPVPPQNSFQSPSSLKSFPTIGSSTRLFNGPRKVEDYNSGLDFSVLDGLSSPNDETIPRHFSLSSPLSEFSLVVRTPSGNPDFWASTSRSTRALESLETTEELLYVSPSDEGPVSVSPDRTQLLLFVTIDRQKGVYSIWNSSYLDSKPISKIMTGGSTPTIGTKNRRRSSFIPTTGNVTPGVRSRDNARDSLGITAAAKAPTGTKKTKRQGKKSLKDTEDTLASQMDPDFEPRRTARESRRVSSMISRADLNPSFDRSAFQDLASQGAAGTSFNQHGRRGHSLGNAPDRISFGAASQRRMRASTPGAFSRLSIDEMSDMGSGMHLGLNSSQASTTFDEYETLADVTMSNDDIDGIDLQAPLDGLKKEILVRKFAEIPVQIGRPQTTKLASTALHTSSPKQDFKVVTMLSPLNCEESGPYARRFFLYIFNRSSSECVQVEFSVRHKNSPTSNDESNGQSQRTRRAVPLPSFRNVSRFTGILDVIKVSHGDQTRILFLENNRSSQSSVFVFSPWSPEASIKVPLSRLRLWNPYDITSSNLASGGIGSRRSLMAPKQLSRLLYAGPNGLFDMISSDGRPHRLLLQIWPRSKTISKIFDLLHLSLPLSISEKVINIWWNRNNALSNVLQKEWHAFAISVMSLFLACEGDRRRRKPRKNTDASASNDPTKVMQMIETSWNGPSSQLSPAWNWALKVALIKSPVQSPQQKISMPVSPSKLDTAGFLTGHVPAARDFLKSGEARDLINEVKNQKQIVLQIIPRLMSVLHLVKEEMKLNSTSRDTGSPEIYILAPLIAQLGRWLDWPEWDWKESRYYHYEIPPYYEFEDGKSYTSFNLP